MGIAPTTPKNENVLEPHVLERDVSRRNFLKASVAAGGGLLLSFGLPVLQRHAEAAAAAKILPPNAFIRIDPDNAKVTVVAGD